MIAATVENYSYPTGITAANSDAMQLQVFPNPASDIVNLLYNLQDKNSESIVEITDVQGKVMQHFDLGKKSGQHQLTLDVSSLPSGIYFANLISGKEKTMQKVIVTK